MTESHGSWSNRPSGYSYEWQDCDSIGGNCQAIAGATGQAYTLGASDVGSTIRVVETARNASGAGSPAASTATTVVQASPGGSQGGSAGGSQGGSGGGQSGSGGGQEGSGGGQEGSGGSPSGGSHAAVPNTLLVKEQVSGHSAKFHFRATGDSNEFQCALVRKPTRHGAETPSPKYSSCGSAKTFKHLKVGRYVLYVRALGPGGADTSPATYKFKIT